MTKNTTTIFVVNFLKSKMGTIVWCGRFGITIFLDTIRFWFGIEPSTFKRNFSKSYFPDQIISSVCPTCGSRIIISRSNREIAITWKLCQVSWLRITLPAKRGRNAENGPLKRRNPEFISLILKKKNFLRH